MADDTEAFITKEAAKELRNKLSSSGAGGVAKNEQLDDYDEVLKDMIRVFQNRQKSDQQFYFEKKYFDYLPNEIPDTDVVDSLNEELNSESISPSSGGGSSISIDDEESVGAKRAKRDVKNSQAGSRDKRQIWYAPVPLHHHSPIPNLHFYYPVDLFSDFNEPIPAYQSRTFNNNPWTPQSSPNIRFHSPGNFYLPPQQPTPRPPSPYLPPTYTNRQPVK